MKSLEPHYLPQLIITRPFLLFFILLLTGDVFGEKNIVVERGVIRNNCQFLYDITSQGNKKTWLINGNCIY